jgi:hypothetical protein
MESRDFYTPRKRRRAHARALPDAGVAVSACGLAAWSFTFIKNIYYITFNYNLMFYFY